MATTYDLGPIAMERRLDELDRLMDTEAAARDVAQSRSDRGRALRGHDDHLDVAEVRDRLSTAKPPAAPPVVSSAPTGPARTGPQLAVHAVPHGRARSGLTCWAVSAACMVGWRDGLDPSTDDLVTGSGVWAPYADGRQARSLDDLSTWGLTVLGPPDVTDEAGLVRALHAHGPLWLAAAPPGPHAVVVSGVTGDLAAGPVSFSVIDPCAAGDDQLVDTWHTLRMRVDAVDGAPLTLAHLVPT